MIASADWRAWRLSAAMALAALASIAVLALVQSQGPLPFSEGESSAAGAYEKLPLSFVPNAGQTDRDVRYYARGEGFGFYFTPDKAVLSFTREKRGAALHLTPLGASPSATLEARERAPGKVNYFVGSERHANLPTYREIAYKELWPGIDMVFRGRGGSLKYEFRLAPGADPSRIRLAYRGAESISLGAAGSLLVSTPLGTLRDARPRSYQRTGAKRAPVSSRFTVDERGRGTFGFAVAGSYDRRRPLVIDPGLAYSTYLGASGPDFGIKVEADGAGNAYVGGQTKSPDFPATPGAFDVGYNAVADAFVAKLNPSGSSLVYATYIGGSAAEAALGLAIDGTGHAFVSGGTGSSDFPTTPGVFDQTHNGNEDVWVVKLSPSGSTLLYSTVVGGGSPDGEFGNEITVDADGNAFVTGGAGFDLPTTTGSFDESHNGGLDAFVFKLNSTGTALTYSTFLGGAGQEAGAGIAVDAGGNAYVTGNTSSPQFPTTAGGFDTGHNGSFDAFVTVLNPAGTAPLIYSTFLGGGGEDRAYGLDLGPTGRVYVAGWTSSSNYPTTAGAFDETHNGGVDAFVTKLDASGSAPLSYSTYLGGAASDEAFDVAVDGVGSAHVTGATWSANFPTTVGAHDESRNGAPDAFMTKLNAAGSFPLAYSTYLGGTVLDRGRAIALDGAGAAYVTGRTESADFPTTPGAHDSSLGAARDGFVTKVVPVGTAAAADHYVCYGATGLSANDPDLVMLRDQFESGQFDPGKADRLCSPAQKNDEPVHDSATYLKRYPLTGAPFASRNVLVTDQFGQYLIGVTGPRFLLVPTSRDDPSPPDPGASGFEHYKCYVFNKQPTVQDQFQTRTVGVVAWTLCIPAQKNDEEVRDPNRHLLCYQISGPAPTPNEVDTVNQFGAERLRLGIQRQFCVPSTKEVQLL